MTGYGNPAQPPLPGAPRPRGKTSKRQHLMSQAQYKKYLHYLRTHPLPPKRHTAKRVIHQGKRGLAAPVLAGQWIIGGNDALSTCVATAVANSLLADTGIRVSDADVLALHAVAGDDDGATMTEILEALMDCGLADIRPQDLRSGGLSVAAAGSHAFCLHPGGLVTWGQMIPATVDYDEAWGIRWR